MGYNWRNREGGGMITGGPPFFSLRVGATGGKVALPTTLPPVAPTPPPLPVPPPVQLKFLVGNNLKPPWPPTLSPYYLPAMVMVVAVAPPFYAQECEDTHSSPITVALLLSRYQTLPSTVVKDPQSYLC